MSEIPWSSAFTILAVVVGFLLSQVADLIKGLRKTRTIRKALVNELSVAKDSLSFAVSNDHKLPKDRLPIITDAYDTSKGRLASILNPKQLFIVQKAYAQVKQVGSPMKSGDTLFRGYIEIAGGGDHVIYQHDLANEIALLEEAIAELS